MINQNTTGAGVTDLEVVKDLVDAHSFLMVVLRYLRLSLTTVSSEMLTVVFKKTKDIYCYIKKKTTGAGVNDLEVVKDLVAAHSFLLVALRYSPLSLTEICRQRFTAICLCVFSIFFLMKMNKK